MTVSCTVYIAKSICSTIGRICRICTAPSLRLRLSLSRSLARVVRGLAGCIWPVEKVLGKVKFWSLSSDHRCHRCHRFLNLKSNRRQTPTNRLIIACPFFIFKRMRTAAASRILILFPFIHSFFLSFPTKGPQSASLIVPSYRKPALFSSYIIFHSSCLTSSLPPSPP